MDEQEHGGAKLVLTLLVYHLVILARPGTKAYGKTFRHGNRAMALSKSYAPSCRRVDKVSRCTGLRRSIVSIIPDSGYCEICTVPQPLVLI